MLALMSIGRLFSLLQPFPPSLLGEGRHVAFVVCQILMNISEFLTNCDGKVKVKVKYINSSWLYVKIQTIKVHIIDKKALGWNSTHLILAIYRMVGKPTIWVEIQHASMTMWLWGWGFKPVLAQCVPHSCHEGTTHRRLNWRGFKKKSCIQRLSQCSFCHKLVGFPTSKKGQKLKNVSRHLNFFVGSHLKPSNIQDNMDRKHHAKNWVPNNKNKWNLCQKLKYALWCSGGWLWLLIVLNFPHTISF